MMRLHRSINACFRLLTAGWKFGYREANLVHDPTYRDSFQCHRLVFVPLMSLLFPGWCGGVGGDILRLVRYAEHLMYHKYELKSALSVYLIVMYYVSD